MKNPIRKTSPNIKRREVPPEYYLRPKESKWETEEFGPGKTDVVLCPKCNIVYYDKSWHHNLRNKKNLEKVKHIGFKLCPVCDMTKNNQWEGELRILGVPSANKKEITHITEVFGSRAYERDPLDRIIKIKSSGRDLIVYISENQLTQRLAKKLYEVYKKKFSKPVVHKGKGGDVFMVMMEWIA